MIVGTGVPDGPLAGHDETNSHPPIRLRRTPTPRSGLFVGEFIIIIRAGVAFPGGGRGTTDVVEGACACDGVVQYFFERGLPQSPPVPVPSGREPLSIQNVL